MAKSTAFWSSFMQALQPGVSSLATGIKGYREKKRETEEEEKLINNLYSSSGLERPTNITDLNSAKYDIETKMKQKSEQEWQTGLGEGMTMKPLMPFTEDLAMNREERPLTRPLIEGYTAGAKLRPEEEKPFKLTVPENIPEGYEAFEYTAEGKPKLRLKTDKPPQNKFEMSIAGNEAIILDKVLGTTKTIKVEKIKKIDKEDISTIENIITAAENNPEKSEKYESVLKKLTGISDIQIIKTEGKKGGFLRADTPAKIQIYYNKELYDTEDFKYIIKSVLEQSGTPSTQGMTPANMGGIPLSDIQYGQAGWGVKPPSVSSPAPTQAGTQGTITAKGRTRDGRIQLSDGSIISYEEAKKRGLVE